MASGTMKGGGIENPAFEAPGAVLGRQCYSGPANSGADAAAPDGPGPEEGPCGWGPCSPRALQLCNNPEGYLAAYSLLAIFQGNLFLLPRAHAVPHPGAVGNRAGA